MWIRQGGAGLALVVLLGACADHPTQPPANRPEPLFGYQGQNETGLIWRTDSLTKSAFVSWTDETRSCAVWFSEGSVNHQRSAALGYAVFEEPSGDLLQLGFGQVPARDVRGGVGTMSISTDTAELPDFYHLNDPGGPVSLTLRQVAGKVQPSHVVQRFEFEPFTFFYNLGAQSRAATATGQLLGMEIPAASTANLLMSRYSQLAQVLP